MKEKILYVIIGIIIGAIITTGVFMIINKNRSNNGLMENARENRREMDANNLPEDFDANNIPGNGKNKKSNNNTTTTTEQTPTNSM